MLGGDMRRDTSLCIEKSLSRNAFTRLGLLSLLSPLYTIVSKKVTSISDFLGVNFIVE